jgi:hypothetical protein
MKKQTINVKLPEGKFKTKVLIFNKSDKKKLYKIYKNWRILCNNLNSMNGRSVNVPEGLSESAFCAEMKCVKFIERISSAKTSFDCFNPKTSERIQVKACSVLPDLTSFGPKSVWDKIYFLDFYRKGKWDGKFDIYLISNRDIYNHKVKSNETLTDQQKQKRRPRFSIYSDIILKKKLKPIKIGKLKV